MSVMLYAHPGEHEMHGDKFDYIIVDEKEVKACLKKGWSMSTTEALEKAKAAAEKPGSSLTGKDSVEKSAE